MLFQLLIFTCMFSYGLWKIPKCIYSTKVMGYLMSVIFYVYYGLNLILRYFNPFWIYFLYEVAESESRFMLSTILCYFNKLVKNLTLYNWLELFFYIYNYPKTNNKKRFMVLDGFYASETLETAKIKIQVTSCQPPLHLKHILPLFYLSKL